MLLTASSSFDMHAQTTPAPPVKDAEKTEKVEVAGKPDVTWLEHRDMTVASVLVYLVGEPDGVRNSKDVLQLVARFRSKGRKVVQPAQVELGLTSYSEKPKYAVDHKLTLIADGQTILTQDVPPPAGKSSGSSEYHRFSIGYPEFAKFANANRAVLKFGGTTIELTPEMSKSLKDLDATIGR
jgi:hypothetical protein